MCSRQLCDLSCTQCLRIPVLGGIGSTSSLQINFEEGEINTRKLRKTFELQLRIEPPTLRVLDWML